MSPSSKLSKQDGSGIIKSGYLMKLSGKYRFKSWKTRKCVIKKSVFEFYDKKESKKKIMNLEDTDPFIIPENSPLIKKFKRYNSKHPIDWSKTHVLWMKGTNGRKSKYFAISSDQVDDWLLSIVNAERENKEDLSKGDVKFILSEKNEDEKEESVSSNEQNNKDENMESFSSNEEKKDEENDENRLGSVILKSTKESPFTEPEEENNGGEKKRRGYAYSLRTMRKTNILDFTFDE